MDPVIATVFIIYFLIVLGIGIYAARYAKTVDGFLLADRKVGSWVTAISSTASSESGWLLMGAVGEAYLFGLSGVWIAIGCLLGYIFNWFFFAERFRRQAKKFNALTIPDFLEARVRDNLHIVRITAVIIIFILMMTYVSAQLTAAGKAFQSVFGWNYSVGVIIGAAVTIIYTTVGGFRAVSWTDLVQGLLMVTALVVLPILALIQIGGPTKLINQLHEQQILTYGQCFITNDEGAKSSFRLKDENTYYIKQIAPDKFKLLTTEETDWICKIEKTKEEAEKEPKFLLTVRKPEGVEKYPEITFNKGKITDLKTYLQPDDTLEAGNLKIFFNKYLTSVTGGRFGLLLLGFLIAMLGIGLGYPGTPHVITRYMAARSEREIKRGRIIAMSWGILAMYGAVIMGLCSIVLLPNIGDPEHGLLESAKLLLHPILAGLVLAAVISAVRSTADSQILVATSAVSRDIYQKTLGKEPTQQRLVWITRITVMVLGLTAIIFALTKPRVIFWFVLFSWAGLGASFAPVLILSVYWKGLTKWGAFAGIVTGFVTTVIWKLYIRGPINEKFGLDIYELVPAFILAFLAIIIVSLFTPKPSQITSAESA